MPHTDPDEKTKQPTEQATVETPETPTPVSSHNDGVDWREVADDVGQFVVDALITIFT